MRVRDGRKVWHFYQRSSACLVYWEFRTHFLPFPARNRWWSIYRSDAVQRERIQDAFGVKARESAFVFYGDQAFSKDYQGDPSLGTAAPQKKRWNFVLAPSGTKDVYRAERQSTLMRGADAFNEIIKSAYKRDLQWAMEQSVPIVE